MLFFRKKPAQPAAPADKRRPYRTQPDESLRATLRVDGFGEAQGGLVDLSARGAGVQVAFVEDPNLAVDDLLEVLLGFGEGPRVCSPARVVCVEQVGETHLRYGLEFLDDGTLLPQLDAFCRRYFNRRNHARLPAEERHLSVALSWVDGSCKATFGNLSEAGLGFFSSSQTPVPLRPGQRVGFVFRLPGIAAPFRGAGIVRYAAQLAERRLFGLEFDATDEELAPRLGELREFIARRAAQLEAWERGWAGA